MGFQGYLNFAGKSESQQSRVGWLLVFLIVLASIVVLDVGSYIIQAPTLDMHLICSFCQEYEDANASVTLLPLVNLD